MCQVLFVCEWVDGVGMMVGFVLCWVVMGEFGDLLLIGGLLQTPGDFGSLLVSVAVVGLG